MKKSAVSIVMSCYNEAKNIERGVLQEIYDFMSQQPFDWEVVISDDMSTDTSLQLMQDFAHNHSQFKIFKLEKKGGKPGGIWNSIQHAKYPLVLLTDVDQSTPLKEMTKLIPFFNQNYDLVIGSRGQERQGFSPIRLLGSFVFASLRNFLLRTHITDTQCGFKSMKTAVAKKIFPRLAVINNIQSGKGWRVTAYDVELLFIAQKSGYKIKEVPVIWKNEDTSTTKGDANARYIKESKQMAQEVWRIFINNLKGKYEPS